MRVELGAAALAVAIATAGCAIRLDTAPPPPVPDGGGAPVPPPGCTPLADVATLVTGRLDSLRLGDGRVVVVAGDATVDGQRDSFVFAPPAPGDPASFGDCLTAISPTPVHPAVDLSALLPGDHARPLAGVTTAAGSYLFFSAVHADGFAGDGFGVARWDGAVGRFVAPVWLWTADRPSYGSGAAVDGDTVYVYGGRAGDFLADDMFVARAPAGQIDVASAYVYWQGGGAWTADPDRAAPFAQGGGAPSVAWVADRARFLLAYTTPLSTAITLRSGLGPSGPWSGPVTLGPCALGAADPGAFCGDVVLNPLLASGAGEIPIAQAVATLNRPAGVADDAYRTRLVRASWPDDLP